MKNAHLLCLLLAKRGNPPAYQLRRTVYASLSIWITAFAGTCFVRLAYGRFSTACASEHFNSLIVVGIRMNLLDEG